MQLNQTDDTRHTCFLPLRETGVSFCVFGGCCVSAPLFEGVKLIFPPRLFVLIH